MGYGIFALVLLGLALAVWLILQAVGRHRERINQMMQRAGFFEVHQPEPELVESMRSIFKRNSDEVTIRRIFRRNGNWCDLYMFDSEPAESAGPTMMVRSNRLKLPSLILDSKVPLDGKVGQLLNKFREHVISRQLPAVDLSQYPEIAARYSLFSDNSTRALALITPQLTSVLLESSHLFMVSGEGDIFGFTLRIRSLEDARQRPTRLDSEIIRTLADEGQRLFECLAQTSHHSAQAVRT